jgi:hypothetical protein
MLRIGKMIAVPKDATDADMPGYEAQLQAGLDRVREFAEANVGEVGTQQFPYHESSTGANS